MEKATISELSHVEHPMGINSVRRSITDALDAESVAITYYELEPGEAFSAGLHTHYDQEELFYVMSGTATFHVGKERETREAVTIDSGELIRFGPGEFQTGGNESDEPVVALAISAPGPRHDWAECDVLIECEECGDETHQRCTPVGGTKWETERIDLEVICERCGTSILTAEAE